MSSTCARARALTYVLPLCLVYTVGALCGWGSRTLSLAMGDFGLGLAAGAAAASCTVKAVRVAGRERLSWALLGASAAMVSLGNLIWGWYEVVLGQPVPTPGPADWIFLFFAPTAIAGLLLIAQPPRGLAGWTCIVLDGWLVAGSLFTLGWSLVLSRNTHGDRMDAIRVALALAYPILDILLVSMVVGLRFKAGRGDRAALNLALVALAVTVISDALFTTPGLHGGYRSGQLLDAGWFAGSLLLAAAPWIGGSDLPPRTAGVRTFSMLSALTPYVAAAVCTAGVIGDAVDGRPPDPVVLGAGGSVLVALVLRQGITLVDNVFMAQELAAKERHFRSLVQGSSDVIMITAPDGVLSYVSHAVRHVYGFEPEELVSTRLELLVHPDDQVRLRHELDQFRGRGEDAPMVRVECRIRSADGAWLHTESAVNRYGDGLIFNSRDVTDRVRLQAQLEHDAFHDRLTDLPNRALFEDRIDQALAARRGLTALPVPAPTAAVLFLDLDGFKAVNDVNGHAVGDELLVQAARRLKGAVRAGDTVARFGGDEFAALLVGDPAPGACRDIAERLLHTLSAPYRIGGVEVRVAASIGVAFSAPGIDPAELIRRADDAMYAAKDAGKGRVEVYDPALHTDTRRRRERARGPEAPAETAVHSHVGQLTAHAVGTANGRARHNGRPAPGAESGRPREPRTSVVYQPVVDLATGRIRDVEAILRRNAGPGSQGAHTVPFHRLAAAGDGSFTPLGRRILEQAVDDAARWRADGHDVGVGVGLTARQVADPSVADLLGAVLRRGGLSPSAFTVEITENLLPEGPDAMIGHCTRLRRLGVRLSVDDFGTGRSSLAHLRRMPVDHLKIDRSFVSEIGSCPHLTALASTIVRLGLDLELTLVAAGVETRDQARMLREMGCQRAQGPLFGPPSDVAGLLAALGGAPSRESAPLAETVPEAVAGAVAQIVGAAQIVSGPRDRRTGETNTTPVS